MLLKTAALAFMILNWFWLSSRACFHLQFYLKVRICIIHVRGGALFTIFYYKKIASEITVIIISQTKRPSFQAVSVDYIQCSYKADVCKTLQVGRCIVIDKMNVTYQFFFTSPALLVRLTWVVYEIGDKWPHRLFNAKSIFIHIKEKLAALVKGDPKAPFSIATTQRCREGCNSIPWFVPLYPWSLLCNAKC